MCGRFTLTRKDFRALAAELEASFDDAVESMYRPRYNIAPTDQHWIVRDKREQRQLLPAKFGLVNSWAKDAGGAARQINARSETALSRPAFREAFERRRCVVPADGFFEWVGAKEARRPIWFHSPEGGLLLFAGLYESWQNPKTSEWTRTFSILTTSANEIVAPVHDRMPVLLDRGQLEDWLHVPGRNAQAHAEDLRKLLAPAAEATLVATEVSRRANSVANDDEACLAPAPGEALETPRLF
jgi:putative SOS response-associated peptidase YedK